MTTALELLYEYRHLMGKCRSGAGLDMDEIQAVDAIEAIFADDAEKSDTAQPNGLTTVVRGTKLCDDVSLESILLDRLVIAGCPVGRGLRRHRGHHRGQGAAPVLPLPRHGRLDAGRRQGPARGRHRAPRRASPGAARPQDRASARQRAGLLLAPANPGRPGRRVISRHPFGRWGAHPRTAHRPSELLPLLVGGQESPEAGAREELVTGHVHVHEREVVLVPERDDRDVARRGSPAPRRRPSGAPPDRGCGGRASVSSSTRGFA